MSTTAHDQVVPAPTHVSREKTDGMLRQTRLPNEPREYLVKREELRSEEIALHQGGWRNLRLLSAGDSATSVFTRDEDGTVRHSYTNHPWLDDEINERGQDLLVPVYTFLDLTPHGRGEWYASLDYGTGVRA